MSWPLTLPEAQALVDQLTTTDQTIAVAESCTAGLLSAALAGAVGGGEVFRGGVVAYGEQAKVDLLDVAPGPVITPSAAKQMARGAARLLGADVALATTGVVGPEPMEGEQPGTVWVGLASGRQVSSFRLAVPVDEEGDVRLLVCRRALGALQDFLGGGHVRAQVLR